MSNNIKVNTYLDKNAETNIKEKLKTYNIDKEMNYVVVVTKIIITNSENRNKNELSINLVPKVNYVVPFVTKKLAQDYIVELSKYDKLFMFLPVENGKIVVKNEDVKTTINDLERSCYNNNNIEYGEMSKTSVLNIIAYNWEGFSEKEKEEHAYKLGGIKDYHNIRSLLDNWKFTPEFEEYATKTIK